MTTTAAVEATRVVAQLILDGVGEWCGTGQQLNELATAVIDAVRLQVGEEIAQRIEADRRAKVRTSISPARRTSREAAYSEANTTAQGIARSIGGSQ